jgi:hypothetical protein
MSDLSDLDPPEPPINLSVTPEEFDVILSALEMREHECSNRSFVARVELGDDWAAWWNSESRKANRLASVLRFQRKHPIGP